MDGPVSQLEHSRSPFRTEPRGQGEGAAAGFLTRNSSLNKSTVCSLNSETAAGGEGKVEPWFGFADCEYLFCLEYLWPSH